MKKGLFLADGWTVNLDNVVAFRIDEDSIDLLTSGIEEASLFKIKVGDKAYSMDYDFTVLVNEFQRIKREISEYMAK